MQIIETIISKIEIHEEVISQATRKVTWMITIFLREKVGEETA